MTLVALRDASLGCVVCRARNTRLRRIDLNIVTPLDDFIILQNLAREWRSQHSKSIRARQTENSSYGARVGGGHAHDLPGAAQGGRQYIVIASGGPGKAASPKLGDSVVAFALPEAKRPLKPCPSTPGLTNLAPGLPRRGAGAAEDHGLDFIVSVYTKRRIWLFFSSPSAICWVCNWLQTFNSRSPRGLSPLLTRA